MKQPTAVKFCAGGAGCLRRPILFCLARKRIQPLFPLMSKEKAAGGKKKAAKGELRRNKLHIPHPVRRKRRTGVVHSVVPPFPTRIASLDSRGSLAPLQPPLKTTKKEAIPFPWNHHPSEYRRCQYFYSVFVILPLWASAPTSLRKSHTLRIPYVKYSTGVNRTTRTVYRALGKPDQTAARRAFGLRTE